MEIYCRFWTGNVLISVMKGIFERQVMKNWLVMIYDHLKLTGDMGPL